MAASNNTDKILMGVGAAALAAGIYFFQTDQGKRNAKKLKGWMVRMKGDVLEKLEEVEEVTEPIYKGIVDTVADAYIVSQKVPRSEILQLATDLKKHWNKIRKGSGSTRRKSGKTRSKKTSTRKSSPRKSPKKK